MGLHITTFMGKDNSIKENKEVCGKVHWPKEAASYATDGKTVSEAELESIKWGKHG